MKVVRVLELENCNLFLSEIRAIVLAETYFFFFFMVRLGRVLLAELFRI